MGCSSAAPVHLYASSSTAQEFKAEFTPDSPLCFDVHPTKGQLLPVPKEGEEPPAAPILVTFTCK